MEVLHEQRCLRFAPGAGGNTRRTTRLERRGPAGNLALLYQCSRSLLVATEHGHSLSAGARCPRGGIPILEHTQPACPAWPVDILLLARRGTGYRRPPTAKQPSRLSIGACEGRLSHGQREPTQAGFRESAAAVLRDEGSVPSRSVEMNGTGDQFLTRPALNPR